MAEEEARVPPAAVTKTAGGNSAFRNIHNDFAHIADPNERRRLALAEIERAPFGCIVYYPATGKLPTSSDNAIKLSTSAGAVVGQLGFGMLADIVGRKRMYDLELIIIIFATLAQALTGGSPSISLVGIIIFWRVLMGVGIGGGCPLSSIITSEFATTKWRGAMMAAVFAMQGFGQLCSALVMMFLTLGFKSDLEGTGTVDSCF
ncbi:Major facilitator, sugar transporter-like [Fusarium oxysporum f. sp. vasinfectum]|nr:Major facilitator, sugar transporter-like [Fusarium oxysporum f. sp. vasinfectum]